MKDQSRWERLKAGLPMALATLVLIYGGRVFLEWLVGLGGDGSLLQTVTLGLLGALIIGLIGATAAGVLGTRQMINASSVTPGPSNGQPAGPTQRQTHLNQLGFEQVGSYIVENPERTMTFAVALSPDALTTAIVGPNHVVFQSEYGGRTLVTTNSTNAALAYEMQQSLPHGSVHDLWDLHQQGIATISASGADPIAVGGADALEALITQETRAGRFISKRVILRSLRRELAELSRAPRATRFDQAGVNEWLKSNQRWNSP